MGIKPGRGRPERQAQRLEGEYKHLATQVRRMLWIMTVLIGLVGLVTILAALRAWG